jgi:hypothetical protein
MNSARITELLDGPIKEVEDVAALLKVEKRPGENEYTFRYRVAYAMQARLLKKEGQPLTEKIVRRMEWLDLGNQLQPGELMPI